jgi:hypothetical protein
MQHGTRAREKGDVEIVAIMKKHEIERDVTFLKPCSIVVLRFRGKNYRQ